MPLAGLQHIQSLAKSSSNSGTAFSHLSLIYSGSEYLDVAFINDNGVLIEAERYRSLNNPSTAITLPKAKETILAIDSDFSTLVPEQLFSEENASLYLTSQLSEDANRYVYLHFYLSELQAYLISAFNPHLLDRSQHVISNDLLIDASAGLLSHWNLQAKQSNQPIVFVAWRETSIEFSAWENNKVLSYSKQPIQGSEDISYLLFYFMEQLPQQFRSTSIYYSGWHSNQQEIVTSLNRYHENCHPDDNFNQRFFTDFNKSEQSHLLTHLLSLTLCA